MPEDPSVKSFSRILPRVLLYRVGLWLGALLCLVVVGLTVRVGDLSWGGRYGWVGTPAPSLGEGVALGQTLELKRPFLSHLSLLFGTFGKTASGRIEVRLLQGPDPPKHPDELRGRTLATTIIRAAQLKDSDEWTWRLGDLGIPGRECYLLVRRLDEFDSQVTLWLDRAREFAGPRADILATGAEDWSTTKAGGHISLALGYDREPRLLTYLLRLTGWGGWTLILAAGAAFYLIVLFNWSRHGLNLALVTGSLVLTLLILEFGLRAVEGELFNYDNFLYKDIDLFHSAYPTQFDERLGFIPKVGFSSDGRDNLWHKRIHILKQGIRSNGRSGKLPPRPLILCVGDSFTFGAQVHDEETWPALLEQNLKVRTVNAGVFGFGLDQSVLRAEQLVPQYRPDLLIVGLIQDDILRNRLKMRTGVYKPYFTINGDKLLLHKVPLKKPQKDISPERRIGGYSLLVHTLMLRVNKAYWLHGLDKFNYLKRVETAHGKGVEVACRLFERLAELKKQYGFEVLVFFQYVKDEKINRFAKIRPCVERAGLALADLEAPLDEMAKSDRKRYEGLFDSHMTAAGNEFAARILINRIREIGALGRGTAP